MSCLKVKPKFRKLFKKKKKKADTTAYLTAPLFRQSVESFYSCVKHFF